jgi:hypothetical protein
MDGQANKPPRTPRLDSIEGGLFGAVFGFHKKVMALLRAANLDDEKLGIADEQVKLLMSEVTDEIKRTGKFDIQDRLESAYEEIERLVAELSQSSGHDGDEST